MRTQGLVTIMMPVLNGEFFLPFALESLLAQDYPFFEVIILDNQSTDRTPEICQDYARRDGRIKYIRDTVNRITHDAANHLATFITGEFCVYACDDDLWEPNFLSTLIGYLRLHPEVGLAFSNALYVDVAGNKGTTRLLTKRLLCKYRCTNSPFWNVWSFLRNRRVVPTLFGVYRSEALFAVLPFDTFDETIADVDTLFLVKLMLRTKVHGMDEVLFYYRNKYRGYDPTLANWYSNEHNLFKVWLFDAKHQWRFVQKVSSALNESRVSRWPKILLRSRSYYTFLVTMTILRARSFVGKVLVALRLREGPPIKKDVHFERRSTALKTVGYNPLASVSVEKEKATTVTVHAGREVE